MNRHLFKYFFVCILIFGCSVDETIPTKTITEIETIQPIPTLTITPYHFLLPAVTQSPLEIENGLVELLKTNGNCNFPCFWGIQPDQSSYEELLALFKQLGKDSFESSVDNHHYVSSGFRLEEIGGLYVTLQADIQNEIVEDIVVSIGGLDREGYSLEDWKPYTLEEVLNIYGIPSTVEIYLDILGDGKLLSFDVRVRYDNLDTSLLYVGGNIVNEDNLNESSATICMQGQLDNVKIHLGKNPINYEPDGKLLSDVTDLTTEDFYQIFIDDPSACLVINRQAMEK